MKFTKASCPKGFVTASDTIYTTATIVLKREKYATITNVQKETNLVINISAIFFCCINYELWFSKMKNNGSINSDLKNI